MVQMMKQVFSRQLEMIESESDFDPAMADELSTESSDDSNDDDEDVAPTARPRSRPANTQQSENTPSGSDTSFRSSTSEDMVESLDAAFSADLISELINGQDVELDLKVEQGEAHRANYMTDWVTLLL